MVLAKPKIVNQIECYMLELSTKSWKKIKHQLPIADTFLTKLFFVTIHQQPHLLMVFSNHTRSFLFQLQNNSWIENQNPIVDHEFLVNAEQVSIFELSNKHNRL